jgi:hypothetical protein
MAEVGIPRLERGETITGHIRDFEPPVRGLFEMGGVKSILCVPIFADGRWLGMFGFDDCRSDRDWRPAEIDTIKPIAELVGAAVARTGSLQKLNDANRIVESSSIILYRLDPRPPYPVTFTSQNAKRYGDETEERLKSLNPSWSRRRNATARRSGGCASSGCGLRSTISAPAIPRSTICAHSMSAG